MALDGDLDAEGLAAVDGRPTGDAGVRRRLGHLVGAVSNRVLGELDPDIVVEHLDVNALVARLDIDQLLGRVDIDDLLARADVNAVLDRVDVDSLLGRIDVDGVLDRVEVDRFLDRVDIDRLLGRLDVQRVVDRIDLDPPLARIDVDALLARIDVAAVLARIDPDEVVARIDVQALVQRLDVEALVQRAGIPDLVADSTGQLAGSALDLARRQFVALDVGTWRIAQRLQGRDPAALDAGPASLVAEEAGAVELPDPERSRVRARSEVSGHYAGPVSRLVAFGGDLALAAALFTAGAAAVSWLFQAIFEVDLTPGSEASPWWALASATWLFVYWYLSTLVAGRTPVMMFLGLRIVARDGTPLAPSRALVRTLVMPLSIPFLLGGAWMLVDRERRALHDLAAGSTVVYDWGGRPAEMPTPLSHWIAEHDAPG